MTLYQIQANVGGVHRPTFYLDSNVQGLVDHRHAAVLAEMVLDPQGPSSITVQQVDEQPGVYLFLFDSKGDLVADNFPNQSLTFEEE